MNQPVKSLRMSLRLLSAWLFGNISRGIKNRVQVTRHKLNKSDQPAFQLQGNLSQRLGTEGVFNNLEKIVETAGQSKNARDDIFFDVVTKEGPEQTQTVRLYRQETTNRFLVEVLPADENHGVYAKAVPYDNLSGELTSLVTVKTSKWLEQHEYQYTPW